MAKKKKAGAGEAAPQAETGNGPKTKTDAVKAAIRDGVEMPVEGVAHIKSRYNIDMTPAQFSTYKSRAKKKGGKSGSGKPRAATTHTTSSAGSGNGNPVALARTVKSLVETYGAGA